MKNYKMKIDEKEVNYNIGLMAKQADGSIFVSWGKTDFLVTVTKKKLDEPKDFFPLIINFEEKMYSIGKIPGSYGRREARPSDKATLSARLIDRPLRPLFPASFDYEVQIVITVLGYDRDYEVEMMAIGAASLACKIAGLPLEENVAGITIGKINETYIINPNQEERERLDFELKAAGTKNALNMIEFKGKEQSEEEVLNALDFAHEIIKKALLFQEEIEKDLAIQKIEYQEKEKFSKEVFETVNEKFSEKLYNILKNNQNRKIRSEKIKNLQEEVFNFYEINNENLSENEKKIHQEIIEIFEYKIKEIFTELIVEQKYRLDGRKIDEIRPLSSQIDLISQVHGSALFTRGETQALAVTTLGVKKDEQIFDGLEDEKSKHFLLHYNFPPYSVGETGRIGAPGRREIGHGNLAEKAIFPMIPSVEEFPYTIRVVSEILESNGSSSQATICSATMSLLAAGVPLKKPVAGIAMGLIATNDDFTILTDIAGLEDHLGDMDFKVAGTKDGITAIQMDIKIKGIDRPVFAQCLEQAKKGRLEILKHMEKTIKEERKDVAKNAPRVEKLLIDPKQIREVIGKGGETINKIIEDTDVKIDIEDNGEVLIYSENLENAQKAKEIILKITKKYAVGEIYSAEIYRIEPYGVFVRFDTNQEGLLHISDLGTEKIEKIEEVVNIGDKIEIKIKSIDSKGRMKVEKNEKSN